MSSLTYSRDLRRQSRSEFENNDPGAECAQSGLDWVLLGKSVAARQLRSQVQRIAPYFRIALVRGETGAGKQLVARALHALSPGAGGEFVAAPAAAFAESVGIREGARPVAHTATLLDSARGGTLYLEGVGELSFAQQAGLERSLKAFEESRATLDGRRTGLRIVVASDRDLRTLAAIGQFRQDLYARLSAVEILVPSLRQRLEDIPELAGSMLLRFAAQTGESPKLLVESTIEQLRKPLWPDNLRGLRSVLTHAAALAEGAIIEPRHLLALVESPFGRKAVPRTATVDRLQDVIEQHVLDVLTRCGGNKLRAAELLGISRSTLYRMLDARQSRVTQAI